MGNVIDWNPNWPSIKNDWSPDDGGLTNDDMNAIANTVIDAQDGMDELVGKVEDYVTQEVTFPNLRNIHVSATSSIPGTYEVTAPGLTEYSTGLVFHIAVANDCPGASTIVFNALDTKNLKKMSSAGKIDLAYQDMLAGGIYKIIYDGTDWILINPQNTKIEDLGRIFGMFGFAGAAMTTCGLNNTGEVTLDDYNLYNQSAGCSSWEANTLLYSSRGIGQRFDSIFTANITQINTITLQRIDKHDTNGSLGSLYATLYNETTNSTIWSRIYNKTEITNGQPFTFNINTAIAKGHVLQFRIDQRSYGDANNNYQVWFATSPSVTLPNSFKISTTNEWSTKSDDTNQDMSLTIDYNTNPYTTSGTVVRTYIPTKVDEWENVRFTKVTPANTSITCDVLDVNDNVLLSNIQTFTDISSISKSYTTLKLRWTLSRNSVNDTTPKISLPSLTWKGKVIKTIKTSAFTSTGVFTAPQTGYYKVTVIGAGGGGGYGGNYQGQGGGGGMSTGFLLLQEGQRYTAYVGVGGVGGYDNNGNANGATGGSSSFGGISASGGTGGRGDVYSGYGGSGGSGSGGTYNLQGEAGISYINTGNNYTGSGNSPYDTLVGRGGYSNNQGQNGRVIIEWEEEY